MTNIPGELKYTKEHEWIKLEGEAAIVGITEFAQSELGELVFVELPAEGKVVKKGESICVVESTKAASDVYAPISGKIISVNGALTDEPALVNTDSYGQGWLIKLSDFDAKEVESLMGSTEYSKHIGQ